MEDEHILEVKNLTVSFNDINGKVKAVNNLSFRLKKGETLGIVGESGSGKTMTALSIINLLESSSISLESGKILSMSDNDQPIDMLTLSDSQLSKIRGNNIAMIFQEPLSNLNPNHKCGNQVVEAILTHSRQSIEKAALHTKELFVKVGLSNSERYYNSYPHQLSGGELQRVMIAMAISCNPKVLIADEPTTSLDVTIQSNILKLLKSLQKEMGMSIIFISHDLGVIKEVASRVIVMRKGEIVESGDVNSIFNNPQNKYTQALIACRPTLNKRLKRLPVITDIGDFKGKERQNLNTISKKEYLAHLQNLENNKPILEIKNLHKSYSTSKNILNRKKSDVVAINDLSLLVKKGEVHGLVGESGCGKTTLARCVTLLEKLNSGQILYKGINIFSLNRESIKEYRKKVQIIFQDPYSSLNPRMKVGDAIMEPMVVHKVYKDYKERKEKVVELLKNVGLKCDHFDRYPHQFSGGERQRICIARAIGLQPEFLICDEPVSALDVSVQAQVLNLLSSLKDAYDFSMLFISHDLSVIKHISDHISVMNNGAIVEMGDAESIFYSPTTDYTKRLLNALPASSFDF